MIPLLTFNTLVFHPNHLYTCTIWPETVFSSNHQAYTCICPFSFQASAYRLLIQNTCRYVCKQKRALTVTQRTYLESRLGGEEEPTHPRISNPALSSSDHRTHFMWLKKKKHESISALFLVMNINILPLPDRLSAASDNFKWVFF